MTPKSIAKKIKEAQNDISSLQELAEFIKNNSELFSYNASYNYSKIFKDFFRSYHRSVKIEKISLYMMYNHESSNAHGSPDTGVRNWRREPHLPMGYPAFEGSIELTYTTGKYSPPMQYYFEKIGISIGSGGANDISKCVLNTKSESTTKEKYTVTMDAKYTCTIWLDDWKRLYNNELKSHIDQLMIDKICGDTKLKLFVIDAHA